MILVVKLLLMTMGVIAMMLLLIGFSLPLFARFFQWAVDWWEKKFEEREAKKRE